MKPLRSAWMSFAVPFALLALPGGAAQESAPAKKLDSLAWMAGHWRQEAGTRTTEELWLPPRGGMMIGVNRTAGGRKTAFEFLRIEEDAKGVVYLASPQGAKPTPFRLTSVEKNHAVFENPEHDFPKKIEYRLDGAKLVASIAGDTPGPSWTFTRVASLD